MLGKERVVVYGAGNVLLGDEGVGVHVARALAGLDLPLNIEVIDGGTSSDSLANLDPAAKLVIVDAMQAGGRPGTVYRLHPGDLAAESGVMSLHEAGVLSSLRMMALLKNEPGEIIILGVQPAVIDWGMELSEDLRGKMPDIINAVLREISNL
jgi:hydrogenase maturation protease